MCVRVLALLDTFGSNTVPWGNAEGGLLDIRVTNFASRDYHRYVGLPIDRGILRYVYCNKTAIDLMDKCELDFAQVDHPGQPRHGRGAREIQSIGSSGKTV